MIVGEPFSHEPYGFALRLGDVDFRNVVNAGLMDGIEFRSSRSRIVAPMPGWVGAVELAVNPGDVLVVIE